MSCLSFYLLYFFFWKIREQDGGTVWGGAGCHQWEEGGGKGKELKSEYDAKNVYTCM
jgi:hypothetical protein